MDEDSSDSEGLELEDGTRVGRKATDGSGGSDGGKPGRRPSAGGSGGSGGSGAVVPEDLVVAMALDLVREVVVMVVLAVPGVVAQAEVPSMARTMTTLMMTPTIEERQVNLPRDQSLHWPGKSLEGQLRMVVSTLVQE